MVTRDIKAGTPTQVNSDKIGVQIVPAVYGFLADITTDKVLTTLRYQKGEDIFGRMFQDSLDNVFYNTLETVSISETTYYIHRIIVDQTETNYYCTKTASELVSSDPVYVIENGSLVSFSTFDHLLTFEGEGTMLTPHSADFSGTEYDIMQVQEGETITLFVDYWDDVQEKPVIIGWVRTVTPVVEEDKGFFKDETQPYWPDAPLFQWTDGKETPTLVWTEWTNRPDVGYKVITDLNYPSWHPSEVKSVDYSSESDPCTVSYSVTGEKLDESGAEVWTDCDTQLTDRNNVICNIPRYLYLKFSQDVTITEE